MFELLVKGGPVMVPILLLSVVALAVALERLWSLRRSQVVPGRAIQEIEGLVARGRVAEAMELCAVSDSSYGNIILAGLKNAGQKRQVIKEAVEESGRQEVVHLERYLSLLGTIASIEPLLGLLGTVLGMIDIFMVISQQSVVGNPAMLAGGIGEALITTAAGLVVAVPALLLHRYFMSLVDGYVVELERCALIIIDHIKAGD